MTTPGAATHLTYLQQVNRLASEAGVTGVASSVATVVGNSGQALRLSNWVAAAWDDIQNRHRNWRWMRSRWNFNTVALTDTYAFGSITDSIASAAITRFRNWILIDDTESSNVLSYLTSAGVSGEGYLAPIPWVYFRGMYRKGTQNSGPPIHISIDPQNQLVLGPKPDAIYTISGEYQRSASRFAADGDVADLPVEYDDLIWYKAMEKYGRFYAAPEVLARWQAEGMAIMRRLEREQLPEVPMGAPLA